MKRATPLIKEPKKKDPAQTLIETKINAITGMLDSFLDDSGIEKVKNRERAQARKLKGGANIRINKNPMQLEGMDSLDQAQIDNENSLWSDPKRIKAELEGTTLAEQKKRETEFLGFLTGIR